MPEIAKSDGSGTDGYGVRRLFFAGQVMPTNLTDVVYDGEEGTETVETMGTGPHTEYNPPKEEEEESEEPEAAASKASAPKAAAKK